MPSTPVTALVTPVGQVTAELSEFRALADAALTCAGDIARQLFGEQFGKAPGERTATLGTDFRCVVFVLPRVPTVGAEPVVAFKIVNRIPGQGEKMSLGLSVALSGGGQTFHCQDSTGTYFSIGYDLGKGRTAVSFRCTNEPQAIRAMSEIRAASVRMRLLLSVLRGESEDLLTIPVAAPLADTIEALVAGSEETLHVPGELVRG